MLRPALESLVRQDAGGPRFEVLVVDNNSTDNTKQVIEEFTGLYPDFQYVFEPQQGLSYARNAGVARARAPVVAFTDDDVRAAPDWIVEIKRAFDSHPEVVLVGGKVYPRWPRRPPEWLTKAHWAPLAILDYGDESFYVDSAKPWCVVGANLSVRKQTLLEAGGFNPRLQRVKDSVGSAEDHDFLLRIWASGKRGLYAPNVVVDAEVQSNRLDKAYHRRWHSGHGRFMAMMKTEDIPDGALELFGFPAFFIRRLAGFGVEWVKAVAARQHAIALMHENEIRYGISYLREYRKLGPSETTIAVVGHTLRSLAQLIGRKLRVTSIPMRRSD